MRDILEEFVNDTALTVENVRRLVDDYSLMSHYLGQELELHTKYSSPLREGDENPSFSIFYGYGDRDTSKLYFKDQIGIAQGDTYDFLMLYLNAPSVQELLEQINFDLQLGLGGNEKSLNLKPTIIKRIPVLRERAKLNIVSQPPTKEFVEFWTGRYGVTQTSLDRYQAKCVRDIHYEYSNNTKIYTPKTLTIGYPIGKYNKLYMPYECKDKKFRNDYPQNYVEGHIQLDWGRNDLLVITKSTKEIIFFWNHWKIQAVAGKSETTFIPDFIMQLYLNHFKRVVLWLDPDEAGVRSTLAYKTLYPKLEVIITPEWVKEKDPTDIYEANGLKYTRDLVFQLLQLPVGYY